MKALIKKLLDIVRRALANDPDNTAERDKLRKEVAALTSEKQEVESLTSEINEVIDLATAATPTDEPAEPTTPTEPGKAKFSAGFIASGGEYFAVSLVNNNISPERALLLKGIIESANAAGAAQAAGGASFNSTVYSDDGSGRKEVKYDNAKQKAASDVAILTPLLAEAQAQLSA